MENKEEKVQEKSSSVDVKEPEKKEKVEENKENKKEEKNYNNYEAVYETRKE